MTPVIEAQEQREAMAELRARWKTQGLWPLKRKVVTTIVNPPIPTRDFDWLAYFEGAEDALNGRGKTEEEAIADLEQQAEDYDESLREKQDDERARYGRNSGE